MPQLNDEELFGRSRGPIVIEGEATDITPDEGGDDAEVSERPFVQDPSRDREKTLAESPFAVIPYGPVRALKVEELHTKWHLMEQLNKTIPHNEYDLPDFIYRADLLDHEYVASALKGLHNRSIQDPTTTAILPPANGAGPSAQDIQAHLDAAIVRLDYAEGFPTLPDGMPLWSKLDWEVDTDYQMFIAYLESGVDRALHKLIAWSLDELKVAYHVYMWEVRVKCFDMYKVAQAAKIKLRRMLDTDDSQYKRSEKFLAKIETVLDQFNNDEIKEVGFDKLLKSFGDLMKIQRVAAGLPVNGPPSSDEVVRAPTTNIIMQQIAQTNPQKTEEEGENLDLLTEDPATLALAQDFILRSQKAKPVND